MTKRKPTMSKAQVQFMKENLPAYLNWLNATGQAIGLKTQPWQRAIVDALIRKQFLTEDGHVTDDGQAAYKRATETALAVAKRNGAKIHPRVAQIRGKKADLVIVDEVQKIA